MSKTYEKIELLALVSLLALACGGTQDGGIETYTVKYGEFVNSITVSGDLASMNPQVISAPALSWSVGMMTIADIVEDGMRVEKGKLLIQFDPSTVQNTITDAEDELEITQAELAKVRANHSSEIGELEADLEIAGLNYRISKLKLEQATYEAEIERKQIELNLQQAKINLEQARQDIESRKSVHREEISNVKLKVSQAVTKLEQARETLASLTVLAPSPGIAIIRENRTTDDKFQVDDQVYPGWSMIGLPDLDSMKAMVEINEVDIARIDTGQDALVRLDAYPDTTFRGRVTEVSTLARNRKRNSNVKVFDATVLLEQGGEKLMPGMTVSCEIVVERVPDILFLPLDAVFVIEGESIVYLRRHTGFEPRSVVTGAQNDDYVIITQGLEEGDRVALRNPTEELAKPEAETPAKEVEE